MKLQTALALILVFTGGSAVAEGPRPVPRPGDAAVPVAAAASFAPARDIVPLRRPSGLAGVPIAIPADVSFAPPRDEEPLQRPEHMVRGPAVSPAGPDDLAFAPPDDVRPLARPRIENLADPFMTVAVQEAEATPVPQQQGPRVPLVPDVLAEAPVLPPSPLSTMASPAPATGNEVLSSVSTANQMPVALVLRPRVRPGEVTREIATVMPDQLMSAGPMGKVVRIVPVSGRIGPAMPAETVLAVMQAGAAKTLVLPLARSMRPEARPALQTRRAEPAAEPQAEAEVIPVAIVRPQPGRDAVVGRKGSVCGDRGIKGQVIPPILSNVRGCGVAEPVRVTSVAGVKLSMAADIDCNTARSLKAWVEQGLQPQFGDNPVVQLQVAGHYVCRSRNNIKGNRISEHGKGKAIDIRGFVLASGETLSIAGDWHSKGYGRLIRAAHKSACGVFNTTLGPGSDGYHEDHLHFDTASGRGPYCR